jgi:hypothetical protein
MFETTATRSTGLARLIAKVSNPCILSVLMLLGIVWTYPAEFLEGIKWSSVIVAFLVVLPLGYVYLRTITSRSEIKVKSGPTTFLRQHPKDIIILGLIFGLPSLAVLEYLKAPPHLLETLIALLIGSAVVALIYVFYRVSFHLTALTILIVMAIATWGWGAFILLAGIPLVSWSKHRIHEHSIAQLASGIALAVAISLATLYFF